MIEDKMVNTFVLDGEEEATEETPEEGSEPMNQMEEETPSEDTPSEDAPSTEETPSEDTPSEDTPSEQM